MSFENKPNDSENISIKRDHLKCIIYDLIRTHKENGFKNRRPSLLKDISQPILSLYYKDLVDEVIKESKDKNLLMSDDDIALVNTIENMKSNFLQTDTGKLSKIMEAVFDIKGKENNDIKRIILSELIPMVNDRLELGELVTEKNKRGLS